MKDVLMQNRSLVIFQGQQIRRAWYKNDWWFSVVDVVEVLDASGRPRKYWADLKKKLIEEGFQLSDFIGQLKMKSSDGKGYMTDCANTEGIFRIIQSIPSKKAEPFKIWLARVGYERIKEIENPELAQDRMKALYEKKGYPKSWIEKRLRGIAIRQDLTDEWKQRGIEDNKDFAILTNEIAKATFGKTIDEHKGIKGLEPKFKNQNLRDHMTDLELIFGMLGERVATEITQSRDSDGFKECKNSAIEGGEVAGNARIDAESRIGRSIISKDNYLGTKMEDDKVKVKEKKDKLLYDKGR